MMNKILTISIAGYNVEKYIRETIESLVDTDFVDELEIFIVDDGGTDGTLDIAKEYQAKYPNSIFPVHKENGGYGSTVNYSIAHANGKYFKLLDGDDWFDKEGLSKLINCLSYNDADAVVTPYRREYGDRADIIDYIGFPDEKNMAFLLKQNNVIAMHSLCYKTDVLKNSGMILPEHTPYTDAIYAIEPFANVEIVELLNEVVYCYRIGVEGQTVSKKSMVKNLDKLIAISDRLVKFGNDNKNNNNGEYINKYVAQNANIVARTIMLSKDSKDKLIEYDAGIFKNNPMVYKRMEECGKVGKLLKLLRRTNYSMYGFVNHIIG